MSQPIDLRPDHAKIVHEILSEYLPPRVSVRVFGSRVKWTAKPHSDLDLALKGKERLPLSLMADLAEAFSESDLPFKVDVVDWHSVAPDFQGVIERDGVALPWPEFPLKHFIDPERAICYGIVQPGKPVTNGVPIVRVNNFRVGGVDASDALYVDEDIEAQYARSRLQGGELLITLVGSIGQSAIATSELRGWNVARAVGVVPIRDRVLTRWVKFVFAGKMAQDFFGQRANTTVQTTLNLRDLAELPIPSPPKPVMKRIVALLTAFDDKIELNRRMNATLEAQARALFRDWFVDFGPVKAKMAGAAPYLAPDLWSLFPDRLDDGVPEGWEWSSLGEEFNLTMGQSPPGSTYNDEHVGLPFFQGRTDFGFRFPKNRKFCSAPMRFAERGDTLVSVRAPVGDINVAWEKSCIGRGVAALRHKSGSSSYTLYALFAAQAEISRYEHSGTVFGAINKTQFQNIAAIRPNSQMVDTFDSLVDSLDTRIRNNAAENWLLAQTRDLLLPKLMSGEIRVGAAEKQLEKIL